MISLRPVIRVWSVFLRRRGASTKPGERLTNGSELAAHVEDHDDGHGQCDDVYGARGHLEDDGVGQLDVAGVAVCLDADAAVYGGDGPDGRAQGQRCRLAEGCEVTERHLVGLAPDRPGGALDRVAVVLDARGLEENFGKAEGRVEFKKAGIEPKLVRGGPQRSNPELDRSFPRA